ncbi:MAG: hypothetical protein OXC13_16895 [Caldilineaceae bacterium]|nr:hypothetical protein [Caldilineaceae bacterium]
MNNEKRPNWVKARAHCTLEDTFEQVVDAIKHDVKCFNGLPPDKRVLPTVRHERIENTVHFGFEHPAGMHQGPLVTVRIESAKVQVLRDRTFLFEVDRQWNEQTLTCDLLIEGKTYFLWQISQKAIGDLLFE